MNNKDVDIWVAHSGGGFINSYTQSLSRYAGSYLMSEEANKQEALLLKCGGRRSWKSNGKNIVIDRLLIGSTPSFEMSTPELIFPIPGLIYFDSEQEATQAIEEINALFPNEGLA